MNEELLALQERSRNSEEAISKLIVAVLVTLHQYFILDGEPVVPDVAKHTILKNAEESIEKALRKLSQAWKELVDKKETLERIVSRFSAQQVQQEEMREDEINQFQPVQPEPALPSTFDPVGPEAFFPKLDTFNLETIMEEEGRSEFELMEDETGAVGDRKSVV